MRGDERTFRAAVLIPARNEADVIGRCLEHVLRQDLPIDELEIIVVDGGSLDGTGDAAAAILERSRVGRWEVPRNPVGTTPSNLNLGLTRVTAPIVCRVDSRSFIPADYVRRVCEVLEARPEVTVVGGAQVAVPRSEAVRDVGVARALNNRLGMGLSRYRRGARSGPADTVYLGAFRTAELRGVGGWDDRFATNQDFDLNRRLARSGTVWFQSGLEVGYLPRETVGEIFAQYRRFGQWKARYWRLSGERPRPRQLFLLGVPMIAGVLVLVGLVKRPRATLAIVAAGAVAIEAVGSPSAERDPRSHVMSLVALGAVGTGWWAGVVEGLVRPVVAGRTRSRAH